MREKEQKNDRMNDKTERPTYGDAFRLPNRP